MRVRVCVRGVCVSVCVRVCASVYVSLSVSLSISIFTLLCLILRLTAHWRPMLFPLPFLHVLVFSGLLLCNNCVIGFLSRLLFATEVSAPIRSSSIRRDSHADTHTHAHTHIHTHAHAHTRTHT